VGRRKIFIEARIFVAQHEHRVMDAGHNLPQEEPRAFGDVVMKVRDWLHHGRDFSGLW
jgi:hypothetical protein